MHFLANFIMRGRVQAVMAASSLAILSLLLPPLSLLSSAAVGLVSLRTGARQGGVVLLSSVLASALLGGIVLGNFQFGIAYGVVLWFPIWLTAVMLRETGQLAYALELLIVLAVLVVLAVYVLAGDPAVLWKARLDQFLEPLFERAGAGIEVGELRKNVEFLSHYMTGIVVAGTLMTFVLSLMLARWWQSILYNPGGFSDEFLHFRPHRPMAYATGLVLILAATASGQLAEIGRNLVLLAATLYVMVGTAVLHKVFAATKAKVFLLTVMYLAMFFVPHILLPVALVGYSDTWLHWRKKAARL